MTPVDRSSGSYDVFLSYNSQDHEIVEDIARRLRLENLHPFLDRWLLIKGQRWRPALEASLATCRSVAVFIGPAGMGSWQQREVDAALDRQGRENAFPVIPVLLPGCEPPLGCEAQAIDPGHPLIQIALAAVEDNPARAEFLREFGIAQLTNDAGLCRLAAGLLLDQKDNARASRVIEQATRLGSDHPDLPGLRSRL